MVLIWASRWHSIILDVFQTMSYHYLSRRYLADENKFFGPPPRIAGCSMMVSSSSKRRQRMTKVHHRYDTKLTKQAYGLMRMQLAKLSTSSVTFVFSFDNIQRYLFKGAGSKLFTERKAKLTLSVKLCKIIISQVSFSDRQCL